MTTENVYSDNKVLDRNEDEVFNKNQAIYFKAIDEIVRLAAKKGLNYLQTAYLDDALKCIYLYVSTDWNAYLPKAVTNLSLLQEEETRRKDLNK